MNKLVQWPLLSFLIASNSYGQTQPSPQFDATVEWSQQSVAAAREELKVTRESIANEQRPQLEALTQIQSELATLRRENKQLSFETDALKHALDQRSAQVQDLVSKQQGIQYRLLHLRQAFEENLHVVERPKYQQTFLGLERTDAANTVAKLDRLKAMFAIADAAIDRIDRQIGGRHNREDVLVDGIMVPGTALQFGPYAFFAPDQGVAGLVVEGDDLQAHLRQHTSETAAAIEAALSGNEENLPFDPLLDQAFLNADAKVSLWQHLKSGGLWIIPITLFGFLSTLIALAKVIQIRKIHVPEAKQVIGLVDTKGDDDFESQLQTIGPDLRPIFAEGHAYRNASESSRTAAMSQVLLSFRDRIESKLSLLALTAAVAPLLGLLGTVTGMIKTFQIISLHGAGDARTLSGGISEALVTTEFGLVVAIPALLAHAWLHRRTKRITIQTAALAERFNKTLPGKGS